MSDEEKCFVYTQEYSYDLCNFNNLENYFLELGCSVPYVDSNVTICKNESSIEKVSFKFFVLKMNVNIS